MDARHRDERRRAKARKRAWERQLRKAEEQHQALNDEAAYLAQRIIALEGRNRVIRMFLPRNSELERLRARARQCGIEIEQADARSEERRVGKECVSKRRFRWGAYNKRKKRSTLKKQKK